MIKNAYKYLPTPTNEELSTERCQSYGFYPFFLMYLSVLIQSREKLTLDKESFFSIISK